MKQVLITMLLLLAVAAPAFAATEYRVVANPSVRITSLTRAEVTAIFLKKTPRWSDGTTIVPVDLPESSDVRAKFTAQIHNRPVSAVKSFWQQQIFSGRDIPPVEKASDAQVLEFVRRTPGAVGYVSAATPVSGVTVIEVH